MSLLSCAQRHKGLFVKFSLHWVILTVTIESFKLRKCFFFLMSVFGKMNLAIFIHTDTHMLECVYLALQHYLMSKVNTMDPSHNLLQLVSIHSNLKTRRSGMNPVLCADRESFRPTSILTDSSDLISNLMYQTYSGAFMS